MLGNVWEWTADKRIFGGCVWQPASEHSGALPHWSFKAKSDQAIGFRLAADAR